MNATTIVPQDALCVRRPSARLPTCPVEFTNPSRLRNGAPSESTCGIVRSRLDHHFAGAAGGIIRLVAPAGYGKSSLIGRWVEDDPRRVVWLDIDSISNDPLVLLPTLAEGLAGRRTVELRGVRGAAALDGFGRLVRSQESPFTVVLDDIHRLSSVESSEVVAVLAANLPPHSTLVLAGRDHPHDGAFARLRLDPGVTDLGVEELRFEADEVDQFERSIGANLDSSTRERLAWAFDGWPAGLRLGNLTPAQCEGHEASSMFAGEEFLTRQLAQYIDQEWLRDTTLGDEDLLTTVAVLGRVSGDLCDHVLGHGGSAARLDEMAGRWQFLCPVDGRRNWYRVHGALAALLASRLRDSDRPHLLRLQDQASRYFEQIGDIDEAVRYARRAGDEARYEHLIVEHANERLFTGRAWQVEEWIDALAPTRIADDPLLHTVIAMTSLHRGDVAEARRWIRRSGEVAALCVQPDATTSRHRAVRAVIDSAPPDELILTATESRRRLPVGWRVWADWGIGINHVRVGALDSARDHFESAAFEARLAACHAAEAMLLASAAAAAHFSGDESSAAMLTAASARLDLHSDRDAPLSSIVSAMSALVAAQSGDRRDADVIITRAGCSATSDEAIPVITMLTHFVLADASLRLGERAWAVSNLRLGNQHLAADRRCTALEPFLDELRMRVAASNAASACPSFVLTPAELRVMPYLSTHLSLGDIADRLYVSRNTVKTHASAIYRKLGARSRREAVEVARTVGLLETTAVDVAHLTGRQER